MSAFSFVRRISSHLRLSKPLVCQCSWRWRRRLGFSPTGGLPRIPLSHQSHLSCRLAFEVSGDAPQNPVSSPAYPHFSLTPAHSPTCIRHRMGRFVSNKHSEWEFLGPDCHVTCSLSGLGRALRRHASGSFILEKAVKRGVYAARSSASQAMT